MQTKEVSSKPQIYYIILDAYARNDILSDIYNFKNKELTNFLQNKGFKFFEKSYTNYPTTIYSLASSLNMSYFTIDDKQKDKTIYNSFSDKIRNKNSVVNYLRKLGYKYYAISSDYGYTIPRDADKLYYKKNNLNYFERTFFANTVLFFTLKVLKIDLISNQRVKTIKYSMNTLTKLADKNEAFFAFCHITCPHPPFNLDKEGNIKPDKQYLDYEKYHQNNPTKQKQYRLDYVEQLQYLNKLLSQTIEKILQNNNKKPIIIIQSDHGPGSHMNTKNPSPIAIKERLAILLTVLTDEKTLAQMPDKITPVNLFRFLFNGSFEQQLPILPDKSYLSFAEIPNEDLIVNPFDYDELK